MKSELLLAHIYDMSLVGRLTDHINTILNQFDIRLNHQPFAFPKLASLAIYLGLCRLVHPSRRTLGEELVGLYPDTERYTSRIRIGWLVSQLSTYFLFWSILPILRNSTDQKISTLAEAATTCISDVWFLFAQNPSAMSVLEHKLRPNSIFPSLPSDQPKLSIPQYIYKLAGVAVVVKALHSIYAAVNSSNQKSDNSCIVDNNPSSDTSSAYDPCLVCMSAIDTPTALICGHVLCWSCAVSWTTSRVDEIGCPSCRTPCRPQDLVPLVHYAPSSADWEPAWKKKIVR